MIGRYRLEREIGTGGMGVVHSAFDPDLERRVALKVLRVSAPSIEAKDRLLREARAMARLTHPNVVTVHEVGTTNGRDFIAMELIDGTTLADWLRANRPLPHDVVAAFVAAGRGLAAAHAAGIVHRDFKPHNVLRGRDDRIVVTDFGLAREAEVDVPIALDVTLPLDASAVARGITPGRTPSSLSGITVTGSLLGTPAYMAPEQWVGGSVTPATDQFAYCVALWEALAGERPYRGPTLEELRKQAALGPAALDASRIPRRLRPVLRRGLDPDPAKRWPSMDALLGKLVRAERRPVVALAVGIAAVVSAVALVIALRGSTAPVAVIARCEPPSRDIARVWSPELRAQLATQTLALRAIDADVASWQAVRTAACELAPSVRGVQLACLDGVLARLDAVAQVVRANADAPVLDAGAYLVDPVVCQLPQPPRLMTEVSPEFRTAMAAALRRETSDEPPSLAAAEALVKQTEKDPCASAESHLLAAATQRTATDRARHLGEVEQSVSRCDDERVGADVAIALALMSMAEEYLGVVTPAKIRQAESAMRRVVQRDLTAALELARLEVAWRAENLDETVARGTAASEGFAARHRVRAELDTQLSMWTKRKQRGGEDDLAQYDSVVSRLRERAAAELGERDVLTRRLDQLRAARLYEQGDLANAKALFERVSPDKVNDPAQAVAGIVVDPRGAPVAGATVFAGASIQGDSLEVVSRFLSGRHVRSAQTGADGRFEIRDASDPAYVIAGQGARRSSPVDAGADVRLVLQETSRLEGKVALAGALPSQVYVTVKDLTLPTTMPHSLVAPLAADGSFVVEGVPRHRVRVFAVIDGMFAEVHGGINVDVREPVIRGIAMSIARSKRTVHVLVRSTVDTVLPNAQVIVLPGKVASSNGLVINTGFRGGTFRMARRIVGEQAPKPVLGAARTGDLYVTMTGIPAGQATACAAAFPPFSDEEMIKKLAMYLEKVQVICAPVPEEGGLVTIKVPPPPRFD